MSRLVLTLSVAAACVTLTSVSDAQQPTRRPGSRTIEIRGQVPTPQVVTVRPRENPQFDRNVLVPDYYNADFLALATLGYLIVPRSAITGSQTDTVLLVEQRTTPPAVGIISTPAPPPVQQPVAVAPTPTDTTAEAARRAEIEAIRRELAARRARLDSIAGRVERMGTPTAQRDTTRRP